MHYLFLVWTLLPFLTQFLEFDLINNKVHHFFKTQISQPIYACFSSDDHRVAESPCFVK